MLTDKLFHDIEPFEKLKGRTDINGLEKIKLTLQILNESQEYGVLQPQTLPFIESSPTAFKVYMEKQRTFLTSKYAELIEEGINDGSIKARYPKLTAELFLLIWNVWMMPQYTRRLNEEKAWQRFNMAKDIVDFLGMYRLSHFKINNQIRGNYVMKELIIGLFCPKIQSIIIVNISLFIPIHQPYSYTYNK